MNNNKGLFITVEGGEGVGKSTFIKALSKRLNYIGVNHINTREPGGSPIAEELRKLFNSPPEEDTLSPLSEFLLLSAARTQHIHYTIKPALNKKLWVLCDRFIDSSYVYQGYLGGVDLDFISDINNKCINGLNIDLTFLLDCDLNLSNDRLKSRNENSNTEDVATRYDDAENNEKQKLRNYFLELATKYPARIKVLDSSLSVDSLVGQAETIIRDRLWS